MVVICCWVCWLVSKAIVGCINPHQHQQASKKGCPRKDGATLQPKDPATHGDPDGSWSGTDAKGRPVEVTGWKKIHIKEARWLEVTILTVVRPHATNKERDPRGSWFVWIGDQDADVFQIAVSYVLRFGQKHGYRFDKQALLWSTPRLRTPEQYEQWSFLVSMVHNHLVLARDLVEAERRLNISLARCMTARCMTLIGDGARAHLC
jgi:hypothetical protein